MQIYVNGQPRQVSDGISVALLMEDLQLGGRHLAVEVNLELVPLTRYVDHELVEGDRLEIVSLVGGG